MKILWTERRSLKSDQLTMKQTYENVLKFTVKSYDSITEPIP